MIGLVQVHSERTKEQFHDARGEVSYPEKKYNTHHGEVRGFLSEHYVLYGYIMSMYVRIRVQYICTAISVEATDGVQGHHTRFVRSTPHSTYIS